jgi:hypothetical protein
MAQKVSADIVKGKALKPVEKSAIKDVSAPAVDPHQSYEDTAKGKGAAGFTRTALKSEITKPQKLKPVKTRDASSPYVPESVNNPDKEKVQGIIQQLWTKDSRRAWLVMDYHPKDPNTVVYRASGTGPISEAVALLADDKVQYCLVRLPIDKVAGEINVNAKRDIFIVWCGPKVGVIEKGKKKIHTGAMAAFLKPSHAELQAVRRELLTESNLLYCSDPNGMHIIDYNATADPKAVENLRADILKTDWRENLKHVEPTKDASAPAIDPNQSYEDAVKGKGAAGFTRDALKDQIKKTDWRENLKHTEPAKDASAPAIDPHLKVDVHAGALQRDSLTKEIGGKVSLKHVVPVHDASAPMVPEAIHCPDAPKIHELIKTLFTKDSKRAWILLGYTDKSTIGLEASSSSGTVADILPKLGDDKIQYFLVRFPHNEKAGEIEILGHRDVLVVWVGPRVGIIEKGKKKVHAGGVELLLKPHHANLTLVNKDLLTEENLRFCSDSHAGCHQIEYSAQADPAVMDKLKTDLTKPHQLKAVAKK